MSKLKKSEILEKLAESMGASKKEAETAMDAVASVVTAMLAEGDTFAWPGFVTLSPKDVGPKSGIAPDGSSWEKPASKAVKFKMGADLKRALN